MVFSCKNLQVGEGPLQVKSTIPKIHIPVEYIAVPKRPINDAVF